MIALFTALLLGFAGSLHCVGMCGPIVLALPWRGSTRHRFVAKQILYFLAKASAYATLGLLCGLIGDSFRFFGFQQALSIATGCLLLLTGIFSFTRFRFTNWATEKMPFVRNIFSIWRNYYGQLLRNDNPYSFLAIGYLNGLLPCGFVYLGLASALLTDSVTKAALFMFLFGIGTIPALLAISLLPSLLKKKTSFPVRKLVPLLSFLFAILFIIRGLNLGIPYVSPQMQTAPGPGITAPVNCCK